MNSTLTDNREQLQTWLAAPAGDAPEALPYGAPKTQQRLYAQMAEAERTEFVVKGRTQTALDAGYDPITPPHGVPVRAGPGHVWYSAPVESGITWRNSESLDMVGIGTFVLSGFFAIWLFISLIVPPSDAAVYFLGGLLVSVSTFIFSVWAHKRDDDPHRGAHYNRPIPTRPLAAYIAAKKSRLFDEILVYSTNFNAFAIPAPKIERVDPLLIGRIGQWHFLIAQWGLDEDIAAVGAV